MRNGNEVYKCFYVYFKISEKTRYQEKKRFSFNNSLVFKFIYLLY